MVGDMMTIGEFAHRTGVSRRMLRHWEDVGLLTPAEVDPWNGHRRYAPRQTGRVRAIATLRAVGFGLDTIGDLLASGLPEHRLVRLLHQREAELSQQITEASTRLQEVQRRLASLKEGHHTIMRTLELSPLPGLDLRGLQEAVTDEAEIGDAVQRLLSQLHERLEHDEDIVLTYDGATDPDRIMVSAAVKESAASSVRELTRVVVAAAEQGATVWYAETPSSIGDAWITLDAALEERGVRTTGIYRQTNAADGSVILQAPVVGLTPEP